MMARIVRTRRAFTDRFLRLNAAFWHGTSRVDLRGAETERQCFLERQVLRDWLTARKQRRDYDAPVLYGVAQLEDVAA